MSFSIYCPNQKPFSIPYLSKCFCSRNTQILKLLLQHNTGDTKIDCYMLVQSSTFSGLRRVKSDMKILVECVTDRSHYVISALQMFPCSGRNCLQKMDTIQYNRKRAKPIVCSRGIGQRMDRKSAFMQKRGELSARTIVWKPINQSTIPRHPNKLN